MYKHTIYIHTQMPLMAETMVIPAGDLDAPKHVTFGVVILGYVQKIAIEQN